MRIVQSVIARETQAAFIFGVGACVAMEHAPYIRVRRGGGQRRRYTFHICKRLNDSRFSSKTYGVLDAQAAFSARHELPNPRKTRADVGMTAISRFWSENAAIHLVPWPAQQPTAITTTTTSTTLTHGHTHGPEDPEASAAARHVGLDVAVVRLVGCEDLLQVLVGRGPRKVAHKDCSRANERTDGWERIGWPVRGPNRYIRNRNQFSCGTVCVKYGPRRRRGSGR